jgi:hypothetical protein
MLLILANCCKIHITNLCSLVCRSLPDKKQNVEEQKASSAAAFVFALFLAIKLHFFTKKPFLNAETCNFSAYKNAITTATAAVNGRNL